MYDRYRRKCACLYVCKMYNKNKIKSKGKSVYYYIKV